LFDQKAPELKTHIIYNISNHSVNQYQRLRIYQKNTAKEAYKRMYVPRVKPVLILAPSVYPSPPGPPAERQQPQGSLKKRHDRFPKHSSVELATFDDLALDATKVILAVILPAHTPHISGNRKNKRRQRRQNE
jgi:hypothetical protein